MANVQVLLGRASSLAANGPGGLPVLDAAPIGKQKVTVTGTAVLSSVTCAAVNRDGGRRQIWEITAIDTACWVSFSGTASAGNDFYIPLGGTRWFGAAEGQTPSILNV